MKITDFKNEDAIELISDLIEPISEISTDKELVKLLKKGDKIKAIQQGLKNHKSSIIQILAILNGVPVEEYSCNPITITKDLLVILNDKELMEVFS